LAANIKKKKEEEKQTTTSTGKEQKAVMKLISTTLKQIFANIFTSITY